MRERPAWHLAGGLLQGAAGPVLAGLLLAFLGPFGTHATLPLPARLGFWLTVTAGNWLLCHLAILWLHERWPPDRPAGWPGPYRSRHLALPLLAAAIVLLPATALVRLAGELFDGVGTGPLPLLALQVYLLCAAISLLGYALADPARTEKAEPPMPSKPVPSEPVPDDGAFRRRLAPDPGGRLLWLRAEDHYLRVRTERGEALVLCRLEDAARELEGCGRRVHRSWWVAEAAVKGASGGAQPRLLLSDGTEAPVSRSYRRALRDAGWLARGRRP